MGVIIEHSVQEKLKLCSVLTLYKQKEPETAVLKLSSLTNLLNVLLRLVFEFVLLDKVHEIHINSFPSMRAID